MVREAKFSGLNQAVADGVTWHVCERAGSGKTEITIRLGGHEVRAEGI